MMRREPAHAAAEIEAQVDGVESFLGLEPRARILDLACGAGRQTLELARRGYRVLGLDSPHAPLSEAREAAKAERLNAHFLKSDLRQIPYRCEFDAVVTLSSAFGNFPQERDDLRTLEAVRKALKPDGKLLMDLLNKEWLMRHFESQFWEKGEAGFNFETGHLDNRRTIVAKEGSRTPSIVSLRVYTLTEIKSLIERSGLLYRRVWGGFGGEAYGMDAPRMIVLAEKPPEGRPPKKPEEGLVTAIRIKGRRKSGR